MKNDKKTISASEVNRYLHCPYQWYYERYYGSSYLQQAKRELNERLGIKTDARNSHFKKGLDFHSTFEQKSRFKKVLKRIIVIIIVILLLGLAGVFLYVRGY